MTSQDLLNAFAMACIILAVNATTWEGMIWDQIKLPGWRTRATRWRTLRDKLEDGPEWITKPIILCPVCMGPWWSVILGLPLFYTYHLDVSTIAFIGTTWGLVTIIDTILGLFKEP